jgi:hypothetical protein
MTIGEASRNICNLTIMPGHVNESGDRPVSRPGVPQIRDRCGRSSRTARFRIALRLTMKEHLRWERERDAF